MAKPKRKKTSPRAGGTRLEVPNSGLEVWFYDDANREAIRSAVPGDEGFGGMPPDFSKRTQQGLIVGYCLAQDDDLDVEIHIGEPLSQDERSVARWLEPQTALLRLPSGALCVESNDASRVGPETPGETGARVDVPRGEYRLTLYRIDDEAMARDGLAWSGPREVIVLTPGGCLADAAQELLPFEPRRDREWVGRYAIDRNRAEALVWFSDTWDTFLVNLDSAAAATLSLAPGAYLRTHVPSVGITLTSVFAESWQDARRLPMPEGIDLGEYGYAAIQPMADWDGAEGLFCRREKARDRVEDKHQHAWHPAVVEVLDARPQDATRKFVADDLRAKTYFDPEFLCAVLCDVLPETADQAELPLSDAVDMLDQKLAKMGLVPQGDMTWQERIQSEFVEASGRLYAGQSSTFAAVMAREGSFELVFLSELGDGTWLATGFADEIDRELVTVSADGHVLTHPRVRIENRDEPVAKIAAAHQAKLRKPPAPPKAAPTDPASVRGAFDRFLTAVYG